MALRHIVACFLISAVFYSASVASEVPKTYGGLKKMYLNQKVVVDGATFERGMLEWNIATLKGDFYDADMLKHLPASYKGQQAMVIAVQLNELHRAEYGRKNALGEQLSPDDAENPYVDIVVRFDDGTVAMKTGYPGILGIDLASTRNGLAAEMERQLPGVIGAKLYAVGFSRLYKPTATLEEMDGPEEILSRLSVTDVPLLTPLTITKARFIAEEKAVVFKLALPNGQEALALTSHTYLENSDAAANFLTRISGTLLDSIPKKLTAKEVDAIKRMSLFRGMSKDAVGYAIGFPEKTNDWGRGGEQLIFFSGKLTVYVDGSGKVTDWQDLD
ncbi:MAG TPA: hypothetical protein VJW20_06430 [Candidatus Angelobacter sp.]|nr:hypothetical protein [Candidatus Angelobacter sp.]